MNTKGMKFLAVLAVLAMAVSAIAVFGFTSDDEQTDAATDFSAEDIVGISANSEYVKYLDAKDDTAVISIPVLVKLRPFTALADDQVTIYAKVTESGTASANITIESSKQSGALAKDQTEVTITFENVKPLKEGTYTITFSGKVTPTAEDPTFAVTFKVLAPIMTINTEVHGYGPTTAVKADVVMTGNAGQKFTVGAAKTVEGYALDKSENTITVGTSDSKATFTLTPNAIGVDTISFTPKYGVDSPVDPSSGTEIAGSTHTTKVFIYDTAATAKVIGYAKDTVGEKDQVIFYSDGTALVKLIKNQSPIIKAEFIYNPGTETKDTVLVGGEEYLWLDMAGFINAADVTKTKLKLTSNFADENYDIAVFDGAVYTIKLVANDDGAKYTGDVTTFDITTDSITTGKQGSTYLYKGKTLDEAEFIKTAGVSPVLENLYTDISFKVAPKEFLGYNDSEDKDALNDLIVPSATTMVEDFIFGLLVDENARAYGHWNGIFQILINKNLESATTDKKADEEGSSYWHSSAAGVILDRLTPGGEAAGGAYTIYAPSIAQAGDLVILKITNTANRVATYTFGFNVANVDKDTKVVESGDALSDIKVQMLTNGAYAISGINSSVIITVSVNAGGSANVGYFFGMESVVNTDGHGTAVARLNAFDTPARDGQHITMTGTYYRDMTYGTNPVKVYGNIDNKLQSQEITYSATIDNANAGAIGYDGLATSSAHNVYALTMSSATLGFYAVQGHYSHETPAESDVTEYMIGSEITTPVVDVTGVTLNKDATSIGVGSDETLIATVEPADATDKAVTWTSSDNDVATVDENGKVTGVAEGSVTITVTTNDGSYTATCTVTVTAAP